MNRRDIEHDTIVVTGGTSGLGFSSAQRAMRDWPALHAALLDMKEGRIDELAQEFGKDRVKFFKTDVTDYQSVQDSFKGTLDWRGGFSALVAAAGYATNKSII
jgi:NADP-dependent 3-hydroxy acid dehydrogenase YdfG